MNVHIGRICEDDPFINLNERRKGFYIWLLLVGKRRSIWIAGPHVVGTFHWSKAGRLQKQPQRRADTTTPSPSFLLLLVYYTRSLSLFFSGKWLNKMMSLPSCITLASSVVIVLYTFLVANSLPIRPRVSTTFFKDIPTQNDSSNT